MIFTTSFTACAQTSTQLLRNLS